MSRLLLFLTLILLLRPLHGQTQEPLLDHGAEIFERYLLRGMDDPEQARDDALAVLKTDTPRLSRPEWVQAYLYILAQHAAAMPSAFATDAQLSEVLAAAEKEGWTLPALLLRFYQKNRQLEASQAERSLWSAHFLAFEKAAEQLKAPRIAVLIAGDHATAAYNAGDLDRALELTQKSLADLAHKVPDQDVQRLWLRLGSAMLLEYSGAREKAVEIFQNLKKEPGLRPYRWLKADVHFNYGLALMNSKRYQEAQEEFHIVSEAAVQLDSKLLRGRGLKGLGYAQQKLLNWKAALRSYADAIRFMEAGHEDPVAIADVYKLMATCFNSDRQYARALEVLTIAARNSTAMQDKAWERGIREAEAEAYAGLGRTIEALEASKQATALLRAQVDQERQQELSKLKVSLGLEVEEQKNRLLEEKLRQADLQRLFIVILLVLCTVVIVLLGVALRQTLRAKKSRERVDRILEHIEEGILSIGTGMKVEADLSPYLTKILGLSGRDPRSFDSFAELLNRVDLSSDQRALMRSTLKAVIGEQAISWDLNQAQLPLEVTLGAGAQTLALDWQPIINDAGLVQNILLTVRDITARRSLQKEVTAVKAHASRLEQRFTALLNIDARTAGVFVKEAQERLPAIRKSLESGTHSLSCARDLHTLKGVARTLGFQDISSLVHDLEDQLGDSQKALLLFAEVEGAVTEYRRMMDRIHFQDSRAPSSAASSFLHSLALCIDPVRRMLEKEGLELARVDVQDHVPHWTQEQLEVVQVLLLHGLTNCADHGFILPARKGLRLDAEPVLTIRAFQTDQAVHLELSDNGVGLDLEKLSGIARKLNFVPAEDETIADVVFVEGASTAEQVSSSSGRGMGLAALRHSIISLNGSVNFTSNPSGRGSLLIARIPRVGIKAA